MRILRTLPTIFNCFKYSTYVVVKPDGVSWSAYGYSHLQNQLKVEQLGNLHQFIKNGATLEDVVELVG